MNKDNKTKDQNLEKTIAELTDINQVFEAQNEELNQIVTQLEKSEERFRRLVEQSPIAIWVNDFIPLIKEDQNNDKNYFWHNQVGTRILTHDVNKKMCSMLGFNREEIIGKSIFDPLFMDEQDCKKIVQEIKNRQKGKSGSYEINLKSKSNQRIPVSIDVVPILTEKNKKTTHRSLAMIQDLTKSKQTIQEIKNREEELRFISEFSLDTIFTITKTGKITYLNPPAQKLLGYSLEDMVGKSFMKYVPLAQIPSYLKKLKDVFLNKKIRNFETYVIHKDGNLIPVEINGQLVHKNNKYIGQGTIRDITERRKSEEARQESEETFRILSASAKDAIILLDNQGIVTFWNHSAEVMFSYLQKEAIGKSLITLIILEKNRKIFSEQILEIQNANKGTIIGKTLEIVAKKKDNSEFPIEISISTIKLKGQWNSVGIARDITERKQAERLLFESKKIAEEATLKKSEFLASMSHEIRTPLNAILGFSDILEQEVLDQVHKNYLSIISSSGKNLLNLINNILDLSRVEAGRINLEPSAISIIELFNEIKKIFSHDINKKNLNFQIEIVNNFPANVYLDEARLRQILINLVANAIKFTDSGFIKITAQFTKGINYANTVHCIFSVQDSGIGIADENQKNIFDSFVQQSGQDYSRYGGTGLGLVICKRLVIAMGGDIILESRITKGSTFQIHLPDVAVASRKITPKKIASPDNDQIHFNGAFILIIDCIKENRDLIKAFLQNKGLHFLEAKDSNEATEVVKTRVPNIILLDINLRTIAGEEVAILKKIPQIINIPIVATSAIVIPEEVQKINKLCDAYISKPIQKQDLLNEIKKNLPYTENHSLKKNSSTNISVHNMSKEPNLENKSRLSELLIILNNKNIALKKSSRTMSIDDIESLTEKLNSLGKQFNYDPLIKFSEDLILKIRMLDIEGIQGSIEKFTQLIEVIKTIIEQADKL